LVLKTPYGISVTEPYAPKGFASGIAIGERSFRRGLITTG